MTLSTYLRGMKKVHHFCVLQPFSWATAHCLGFNGDLQGIWQYVHFGEEWQKTHSFAF
jgi:hypothetical protein